MKSKILTLAVIFLFFSIIFIQVSASQTKEIKNEIKNQKGDSPIYSAIMLHHVNMNVINATVHYLIKIPLSGGSGTILIGVRVIAERFGGELDSFRGEFKFENKPYEVKFSYFNVLSVDIDEKPYTTPWAKLYGTGFFGKVYE